MSWVSELLRGGGPVWVLLAGAPLALVIGIAALAVHERRWRRRIGVVALAAALVTSSLASWGALRVRRTAPQSPLESRTAWLHARRAAVVESRAPLEVGLGASLIPLLGGIGAVFSGAAFSLGSKRRGGPRSRRASSRRDPAAGPPSLIVPELGVGAVRGTVALGFMALGTVAAAGALLILPAPGPRIALDSPLWRGLLGVELLEAGDQAEACRVLSTSGIDARASTAHVPEVEAALSECFQLRLDEALQDSPPARIEQLETLAAGSLTRGATDRARAEGELARARRADRD